MKAWLRSVTTTRWGTVFAVVMSHRFYHIVFITASACLARRAPAGIRLHQSWFLLHNAVHVVLVKHFRSEELGAVSSNLPDDFCNTPLEKAEYRKNGTLRDCTLRLCTWAVARHKVSQFAAKQSWEQYIWKRFSYSRKTFKFLYVHHRFETPVDILGVTPMTSLWLFHAAPHEGALAVTDGSHCLSE